MKKNFKNENEDFQNFLREKKRNTSNIENQKDKFLREKLVNENKNIKINNYNTNNKLPYIVYYNGDFLRNKIKSLKKKNSI
jgi:predicted NUDIX family phosphoesterase